ncbi:HK97-gp10 family putative phage morphogenesis protein [Limosilactobacillus equigenerosi]|uniref:HK97-gp10 family putative phage morphogenesis protein n=1 Tax=Limosilactobacillus equigenerosi TaxID=417373 RepID=UPI000AB37F38|nr:HK97-gp10 family putative phage morphogenesis protein [Limosilactobacillus equigenerosi]
MAKSLQKNTNEMATVTKQNMMGTYTHGYSTGTTARSVLATLENGGLTGIVSPSTEYFPYLEYGTRFMSPMPTLHPAFSQQTVKFESDLNKLMK